MTVVRGTSKLAEAFYSREESLRRASGRKSAMQVRSKPKLESLEPPEHRVSDSMKRLRVKSNYARNKTLVLGPNNNLVLHFDRHGVAAFAAHLLPVLQAEMQMRPGRFRVLKDEPKAPESTSQLKEIEEVLEVLKREEEEEELELEIADVEDEDEPESDDEEEDDSTGEDE